MGATRKLALVVVVGLIAISTAITVYTANEPNRRDDVTSNQEGLSIERATSLYQTYCLSCHGPAGLGSSEAIPGYDYRRTGAILNQEAVYPEDQLATLQVQLQSDDPIQQGIAEDWIRFRIMYGIPSDDQVRQNANSPVLMPAFRHDLSVEQINNLVWLVMHGDWNYVYNASMHATGLEVCASMEATPEAERPEMCQDDMHDAVAYPTPPPPADAGDDDEDSGDTDTDSGNGNAEANPDGADHQVVSTDNAFDVSTITAKPGDTITLTNNGFIGHDLVVEGLGLDSGLLNNGESATIVIPMDAEPGDYEFICSVIGHKESGMLGTLTIEAP